MAFEINISTPQPQAELTTHLHYLAADSEPPKGFLEVGNKGESRLRYEGKFIEKEVKICNARLRTMPCSLEQEGFTLSPQVSGVNDFHDADQLKMIYEQELKLWLNKITSAQRVLCFDHVLRSSANKTSLPWQVNAPIEYVHNDYSIKGGPRRLAFVLRDDPKLLEECLKRKFWIVNVWRSITGPVYNHFLALCDGNSLLQEDLQDVPLQFKERLSEAQLAHFNANHAWYYYPQMQMNEALVIKTFDSTQADGRVSLHCSAVDSELSEDLGPRQSIESRCIIFF